MKKKMIERTVEFCCVDGYSVTVKNPNIEKLENQFSDDRIHTLSINTTDGKRTLIPKEKIIMMLVEGEKL